MSQEIANDIKNEFKRITGINCTATYLHKGKSHIPSRLEKGKETGVYVFLLNKKKCFKVGKAGTKSTARWNSHHYNLDKSTASAFTKSIFNDLDNFINYFEGNETDELLKFKKIYELKLGSGFKFKRKTLKKVDKEVFKDIKKQIQIKSWIRKNISRIEFKLVNDDNGSYALDLLEKLVAYKLKPIYEG